MISPVLEKLLQPLEEFEVIRRRAVRLGDRLCDLSYANPYEGVAQSTRDVLRAVIDRERLLDLQYSPFGGQTLIRRAVSDELAARQGLEYMFRDVVLTPGAMAALHVALRVAAAPGDEVVIPVPCWLDYPLYAHTLGLTPVLVPLSGPDFDLDVSAIARAITPRTAALLLANPSNPVGRSYRAELLHRLGEALARSAERHGRRVTLIADETHRDFVRPGLHEGAAIHWPETITVYSFGKYHFIQGQRIGYLAISPRDPHRDERSAEAVRWARITGIGTPTAIMQSALPGLMALKHDLGPVDEWRGMVTEELRAAGYRVAPADGTLFVYIATPDGMDDFEFVRRLADAGTLVLPAPIFHHSGYFRLSLTGGTRMLEGGVESLRRLAAG